MPIPAALVVEDEDGIREVVCTVLEDAGYRVFEAATARDGLALLRSISVDLILTDLATPGGISGCELVALAKQQNPTVRVICSTGFHGLVNHCESRGCDWLLTKPYKLRDLGAIVADVRAAIENGAELPRPLQPR